MEWYHHKPLHDYLDYLAFRFTLRKARWKGDEGNENINTFIEKLNEIVRNLEFRGADSLILNNLVKQVNYYYFILAFIHE